MFTRHDQSKVVGNRWQGFSDEHSWIKPRPPQTAPRILKFSFALRADDSLAVLHSVGIAA